ncbi:MAG: glycosyltransferase family 4 protein [Caldilineaceae bacterium]
MKRGQTSQPNRSSSIASGADGHDHAPSSFRILMVAPTSFFADYGCHVRILEETRVLQSMGHQVTIATYHNGRDLPDIDIARTLPIPWRRGYEVGSSRHKIAFDALLGWKTLSLLLSERYDVIHAHLHEGALIGLLLGRLMRKPVVFDFQGSLTEEMVDHNFLSRNSRIFGPLRGLETWIDQHSRVIFTSSSHAEEILTTQFECAPERIRPLPDCVNTDTFQPAAAMDPVALASLRMQLGIPENAKVIVYLGLLAEYQGTDLLLEAMQRILQKQDNVFLLLMGFPAIFFYERKAGDLGIRHRVVFTGRVPYEDAPLHLALGDVGVAPKLSLTEGSGKLLNYMATALPTVAFDTPVAREYLGPSGLYAVRGDAESLADTLYRALFPDPEDAVAVREMGIRLRQRALHHFDWRSAGQAIVDAYRSFYRTPDRDGIQQPYALTRR